MENEDSGEQKYAPDDKVTARASGISRMASTVTPGDGDEEPVKTENDLNLFGDGDSEESAIETPFAIAADATAQTGGGLSAAVGRFFDSVFSCTSARSIEGASIPGELPKDLTAEKADEGDRKLTAEEADAEAAAAVGDSTDAVAVAADVAANTGAKTGGGFAAVARNFLSSISLIGKGSTGEATLGLPAPIRRGDDIELYLNEHPLNLGNNGADTGSLIIDQPGEEHGDIPGKGSNLDKDGDS